MEAYLKFKEIFGGLTRAHGVFYKGEKKESGKVGGKAFIIKEEVTENHWRYHDECVMGGSYESVFSGSVPTRTGRAGFGRFRRRGGRGRCPMGERSFPARRRFAAGGCHVGQQPRPA